MANASEEILGSAKQALTFLRGLPGIYATLAKEHGEISSLLKQALSTTTPWDRASMVTKIRVEVLSHAKAEEETLYAALRNSDDLRSAAEHSKGEHDEIQRLLREVDSSPNDSEQQTRALQLLQEGIENHTKDEEKRVFPLANRFLSRDQAKALDEEFKQKKQAEKTRLASLS